MISVAKNNLRTNIALQFVDMYRLDTAYGANRHKDRSLYFTMIGFDQSRSRVRFCICMN